MGWGKHIGSKQWRTWTGSIHSEAYYTNDNSYPVRIKSFYTHIGVGALGYVFASQESSGRYSAVVGDGDPITWYVDASFDAPGSGQTTRDKYTIQGTSTSVSVTSLVYSSAHIDNYLQAPESQGGSYTKGSDGYVNWCKSTSYYESNTAKYTVYFNDDNNPVVVQPGQTIYMRAGWAADTRWRWGRIPKDTYVYVHAPGRGYGGEVVAYDEKYNVGVGKGTGISSVSGGGDYKPGTTVTVSASVSTGYSWSKWSGTYSSTNQKYSFTMPKSNVSLYANATINTYPISYNANGGSGAPNSQTKAYGVPLTLQSAAPTTAKKYTITFNCRGGTLPISSISVSCKCSGWNTKSDSTGTYYALGGSYTANAGATLYAQWSSPAAGSLPTPTYPGARFDGWYTAPTGGTQVKPATIITANITVYAHWTYLIQYAPNHNNSVDAFDEDGTCIVTVPPTQTKEPGATAIITPVPPSWPGKLFLEWNTRADGKGTRYLPYSTYTVDGPLLLYAIWDIPMYTVTFTANGGVWPDGTTANKSVAVSHGSPVVPPGTPTYTNRVFQGWAGDCECVTSNRTISAMWSGCPMWIMTADGWAPFLNE